MTECSSADSVTFQKRATDWLMECFSMEICRDTIERNHRFLEEALELVQSLGCTKSEAHQLVDYVFDRDQGDVNQEVGGVMVTLAALCFAADKDMHEAGEVELARVWTIIDKIRAKQAAKPKHSPLPSVNPTNAQAAPEPAAWQWRYVGRDEPWATPSGGERLTAEVLKREPPIEQRPLYAAPPQEVAVTDVRKAAFEEAASLMQRWSNEAADFKNDQRCIIQGNVCHAAAIAIRNLGKSDSLSRPLRQMTDGDGND